LKRGYAVGEFILVSFFFLILVVLIINRFTDYTLIELNKFEDYQECENSIKNFEKLFDDELVMTANSNLGSIISNYTSEGYNISILNSNITQLGFSSGKNKLNYTSLNLIFNNLRIFDWNEYENSYDSFSINVEPYAVNVESIYSDESDITGFSGEPRVNIWLNDSVTNSNTVHYTIGLSAYETSGYDSIFEFVILIPNATVLGSLDPGLSDSGSNSQYLKISGSIEPNTNRETVYFSYSSDTTNYIGWGDDYANYGSNYEEIQNITKKNNLIIFDKIKFYDQETKKELDIVFGNNTNLNLNWGPENAEGCKYSRIYLIEDDSKRINYTINGFVKEININPKIYSKIEVVSR